MQRRPGLAANALEAVALKGLVMRVLLVEDDEMIGEGLVKALAAEGVSVDWTRDGRDAAAVIREPGYVVILLDLNLPGVDGLTLLKDARTAGVSTPVLILTARDELSDRVSGLDLGADDYLCKPFEVRELLARMRALIRRRGGQASSQLVTGDTELDTETRELRHGGMTQVLPARSAHPLAICSPNPKNTAGWVWGLSAPALGF